MNCVDSDQKLVKLLTRLIDIPSPSGEEGEVGEYLEGVLIAMGLEVSRQNLEQRRFNLLATTGKRARVVFCTHMDTVRPHLPSSRTGNVIRGRGACDAKGAIAAMVSAVERLLERGMRELGLLFVVGEEVDSDGARKAAELDLDLDYIILGEPTKNKVASGQKGAIVFEVEFEGKAAHSACPEKGKSAIHGLVEMIGDWLVTDWGGDPTLGRNSFNIGRIDGGVGANVIAAKAGAEGIFRIGTSSTAVEEKLLSYENDDVSIRILSSSEPLRLHVPPGSESSVAAFGSDAAYLRPLGKVLMSGPGSIEYAHGPDEKVTVDELVSARDQYAELVMQLSNMRATRKERE